MLLSIAVPIMKSCLCVLLSGECVVVVVLVAAAVLCLTDRLTDRPIRSFRAMRPQVRSQPFQTSP